MKHVTDFGRYFVEESASADMMKSMSEALSKGGNMIMMGGGNPARIPGATQAWRKRMQEMLDNETEIDAMFSNYQMSRGNLAFRNQLTDFFNAEYDWNLTERNIAVTIGAQGGLFYLLNALGGPADGRMEKIFFPIVPEYVSYSDIILHKDAIVANKPYIDMLPDHTFKYRLDMDGVMLTPDISALCLSRPTNPSGNIVTDAELATLSERAKQNSSYLIIDSAYGKPFPNIAYQDYHHLFDEHTILTFSLSKIGLPGVRTGIVVAPEDIISRIGLYNVVSSLAVTSSGPSITGPLFASGEIKRLSDDVVRPYYDQKCQRALELFHHYFDDAIDYHFHKAEGTFFLWLWLKDLPITDKELYQRLLDKNVLAVPGSYFFRTLKADDPWRHRYECLRISYCLDDAQLEKGVQIITSEIQKVYEEHHATSRGQRNEILMAS